MILFHTRRGGGETNDKKIGGMVPTIKLAPIESAATVTLPRYRVSSSQGSLHYNEKHLREEDHHPPPLGPKKGCGTGGVTHPGVDYTIFDDRICTPLRPFIRRRGVCVSFFFFVGCVEWLLTCNPVDTFVSLVFISQKKAAHLS